MTPILKLSETPEPEAVERARRGLTEANEAGLGLAPGGPPVNVLLREGEALVGVLTGRDYARWLYVEVFWVAEALRGAGWGARMLAMAEEVARDRGLVGVRLDTHSPQARALYERSGYRLYATLPGCPPGGARLSLAKRLDGA